MSHPTWVRGLKHHGGRQKAPTGASHPTWVRGLKHTSINVWDDGNQSHPTWVRGLKRPLPNTSIWCAGVAPYVGAWIETLPNS